MFVVECAQPMSEIFDRLVATMAALRGPNGCPWDKAQTRETLRPFLVEETYEVLDALESGDAGRLKDELGDLLFQVIYHARIAEERGEFDIEQVLAQTTDKMRRRHPHVFGDTQARTPTEALANWEGVKDRERGGAGSVLDGVPKAMPALLQAHRIQAKAARVGFDWTEVVQVLAKVEEELTELKEAITDSRSQVRGRRVPAPRVGKRALASGGSPTDELGDLLFALVNLARRLEVNPEDALHQTTERFIRRFQYIEERLKQRGRALQEASLDEMDRLWTEAKGRNSA